MEQKSKLHEVKEEAGRFHRESKGDFANLADDVKSKFHNMETTAISFSAELSNISSQANASQTALLSLRDLGSQVGQFLRHVFCRTSSSSWYPSH
jgi:hypothetical protein